MREEWVLDIKEQCELHGIPFFFKQWGDVKKKKAGRLLQGRTWDQMPAHLETVHAQRLAMLRWGLGQVGDGANRPGVEKPSCIRVGIGIYCVLSRAFAVTGSTRY
ncbi:MAG: DUF5131 family protein [Phycisphaerae bacterium]|nr:DUF5131 family protein [Planctomycetota bacterium]MBL7221893.1 DUF5131 family protein [Phycisphaerae bacterium]